ncbi:type IV pilus secretin PilQ [Desulfococcaceae bacterium HSG7]|nr:type IV pilus secretin PilQ [Desulfococcaceae bacterium HSG7]
MMSVKTPIFKSRRKLYFILLAITAWGFACGPATRVERTANSENRDVTSTKMITSIITTDEADGFGVLLKSERLLTATSIKQPYPLGVILYLPETVAPDLKTIYTPDSDIVKSIKATKLTDDGLGVRLEILLLKEVSYDIIQEDEGLKIVLRDIDDASSSILYGKPGKVPQSFDESDIEPIEPEQKTRLTANNIRTVSATELDESVNISVQADGAIKDYRSSTMDSPARIVFEMFNVKSQYQREQTISVNTEWVKAVRYYGYPDRVRLVLETHKKYLNNFSAYSTDDGLLINVGSVKSPLVTNGDNKVPRLSVADEPIQSSDSRTLQPKTIPGKKRYGRALVNRIDFQNTTDGRSMIIIGTTNPVRYDVNKQGAKQLKVSLFNTRIPKYRRRPLITTHFESAVDRITPQQRSGATDIAILLREAVPYNVEQEGNLLKITLNPSAMLPKPSATIASVELKDNDTQTSSGTPSDSTVLNKTNSKVSSATETTQKYVGEKISLDFYQTDIKNVFRILREVSKKNFAIDDEVNGKVTLTLDKPVPWDQVLELILKMNSLGMVYEGDIIRIATLPRLKKEEEEKNEIIEASMKAKRDQAALEPLQTEYLPINYVKPESIVKQVEGILTPERGKAEVHAETHQIVITDVPDVIDAARKIISQLDLITEQVLIEARVVEVNTSFSRDLGIRWSAFGGIESDYDKAGVGNVGGPATTGKAGIGPQRDFDTWGGTYGYGMISQNTPAMSAGTIGLEFTRIITSELLLAASLTALEGTGEGKIISSPKVLTLDGVAATITQGDSIPYNKLDDSGNTTTEWKDITLTLTVTPQVTRDKRIRMTISLTNDVPKTFGGDIGAATGSINTELLVNDSETVVIGGIIKSDKNINETRLPWLADIPILGWLFKEQQELESSKEVLIFITPKIIKLNQPKIQNL